LQWDFEDIWCGEKRGSGLCHPDQFRPIPPLVYPQRRYGLHGNLQKSNSQNQGTDWVSAIAEYNGEDELHFVANDYVPEFWY